MQRSVATYEDARIILKLYELRREEKLRAARDWFAQKFSPATIEDVKAISDSSGPENAHYRMVTSYWEMAASFVARGVLNADLFLDSGGELIFVWSKLGPFVPQIREQLGNPHFWTSVEKVVQSSPLAQERVRLTQKRLAARRAAVAGARA